MRMTLGFLHSIMVAANVEQRACPAGWTAASGGCYLVTTAWTTQRWECDRLCGANASLACIGSAEESAAVTVYTQTMAERGYGYNPPVWLGNYRRPDGGWQGCAQGDGHFNLSTFPTVFETTDCACLWQDESTSPSGKLNRPWGADGRVAQMYELPCSLGAAEATAFHCLCKHGQAVSPAAAAFDEAQRVAPLRSTLIVFLGVIPVLSLLPVLLAWSYLRVRRVCRRACAGGAALGEDETSRSATAGTSAKLQEAQRAADALRARVSGTLAWVGWTLILLGIIPFALFFLAIVDVTAGKPNHYLVANSVGVAIFCLALRPTDEAQISFSCRLIFGFLIVVALLGVLPVLVFDTGADSPGLFLSGAAVAVASAVLLAPTVGPCCDISPRRRLRRLWIVMRLCLAGIGTTSFLFPVTVDPWNALSRPDTFGVLIMGISAVLVALVFTRTNRARVHRWLGGLGKRGSTSEQAAAAIAALIRGRSSSVAATMRMAQDKFTVLPLDSLTSADLSSNADTGVHTRVRSASLGECDAFMSHSWRDNGDLKYAQLLRHQWGTSTPTIWLDKVPLPAYLPHPPFAQRRLWLTHAACTFCDPRHA